MAETRGPTKIVAPWTKLEVEGLWQFQSSGLVHEFTCPNRDDACHPLSGGLSMLVPTVRGWICAFCDYQQDWALYAMMDGSMVRAMEQLVADIQALQPPPVGEITGEIPK